MYIVRVRMVRSPHRRTPTIETQTATGRVQAGCELLVRGGSVRGVAQATAIRSRVGSIAGLRGIARHRGFLLPEPPVTRPSVIVSS
jgi:hypothetical protein